LTKEGSFTFTRSRCPAPSRPDPGQNGAPPSLGEAKALSMAGAAPSGERTGPAESPGPPGGSGWRTPAPRPPDQGRGAHVSECRTVHPGSSTVVRREGVVARASRSIPEARATQPRTPWSMAVRWVRQPAPRRRSDQHAVRLVKMATTSSSRPGRPSTAPGERRVGLKSPSRARPGRGHRAGACDPSGAC